MVKGEAFAPVPNRGMITLFDHVGEHHAGCRQHDPQCRSAARPGKPVGLAGPDSLGIDLLYRLRRDHDAVERLARRSYCMTMSSSPTTSTSASATLGLFKGVAAPLISVAFVATIVTCFAPEQDCAALAARAPRRASPPAAASPPRSARPPFRLPASVSSNRNSRLDRQLSCAAHLPPTATVQEGRWRVTSSAGLSSRVPS